MLLTLTLLIFFDFMLGPLVCGCGSGEGSVWSLWCSGGPCGPLASGYYVSCMYYDHIVHIVRVKHALFCLLPRLDINVALNCVLLNKWSHIYVC